MADNPDPDELLQLPAMKRSEIGNLVGSLQHFMRTAMAMEPENLRRLAELLDAVAAAKPVPSEQQEQADQSVPS